MGDELIEKAPAGIDKDDKIELLKKVFKNFDVDADDYLNDSELTEALKAVGVKDINGKKMELMAGEFRPDNKLELNEWKKVVFDDDVLFDRIFVWFKNIFPEDAAKIKVNT